tara:strand:- start:112 stop:1035 length:924 start_codon:yes stop_codon:yes gene_type:complete
MDTTRKQTNNEQLLLELELEKTKNRKHEQNIASFNDKMKTLKNKYNTKKELNKMNVEYNEKLENIKKKYDDEYKNLQEKLKKIESKRSRSILLNNSFKVELDINNNIILRKKNYKLTLEIKIASLQKILEKNNNICNTKLEKINSDYKKILLKNLYTGPCISGGNIKTEIKELKKYNNSIDKLKLNVDEDEYKINHENTIRNKTIFFKNKLRDFNRYYKLELDSIKNLISYYNSLEKLNNIDEIVKLKENQDSIIVRLSSDIDVLENIFKLLNQDIDSYNIICQKKINKILCDKYNKIKSINNNKYD